MTSLATKLGLRPGQSVRLLEAHEAAIHMFSLIAPAGVDLSFEEEDSPRCELIFFWPRSLDGLVERFAALQWRILPDGAIWVVMPKKAFAENSGTTLGWEAMQAAALATDLVDNKVASISEQEYATRFVIRRERRSAYL
ncbi:MAG: hypothetical protein ACLQUY_14760 [Ktedonobacterales bacterium]